MSNFDDVKVGDKVLVQEYVPCGFQGRCFYVPKIVTRVTSSQFLCDDIRIRKSDGKVLQGYEGSGYAGKENQMDIFGNIKVIDQTEKMKEFKEKVLLSRKIRLYKPNFSVISIYHIDVETLKKLIGLIDEIDEIVSAFKE